MLAGGIFSSLRWIIRLRRSAPAEHLRWKFSPKEVPCKGRPAPLNQPHADVDARLGDSLTVEQSALTRLVLVRIQVPQPRHFKNRQSGGTFGRPARTVPSSIASAVMPDFPDEQDFRPLFARRLGGDRGLREG